MLLQKHGSDTDALMLNRPFRGQWMLTAALGIGPMAFRQAKSVKVLSSISY